MTERRWTPKIVLNETPEDMEKVIENVIEEVTAEYGQNLHCVTTTITAPDETRIRTYFHLKDKDGFVLDKQPSLLALSQLIRQIEETINSYAYDEKKIEITQESGTNYADNNKLFTDFIIRER